MGDLVAVLEAQWCKEKKWLDAIELAGGAQILQTHYDFNVALWMKIYRCLRVDFKDKNARLPPTDVDYLTLHGKTPSFFGTLKLGLTDERFAEILGGKPPSLSLEGINSVSTPLQVVSYDVFALWMDNVVPDGPLRGQFSDRSSLESSAMAGRLNPFRYFCTKATIRSEEKFQRLINYAAANNRLELLRLLLSPNLDADINHLESGETALLWATYHGHHEAVELLCAAKADVNLASEKDGRTPTWWAKHKNKKKSDQFEKCLKILEDHGGISPDLPDANRVQSYRAVNDNSDEDWSDE